MKFLSRCALAASAALVMSTPAQASILSFTFSSPGGPSETFNLDTTAGQLDQFGNKYDYAITHDNFGNNGFFFGNAASNGYSGAGDISGNQINSVAVNSFFSPAIFSGSGPIAFAPGQSFSGSGSSILSFSAGPVPEPATWAFLLAGLGGLGVLMRRQRMARRSSNAARLGQFLLLDRFRGWWIGRADVRRRHPDRGARPIDYTARRRPLSYTDSGPFRGRVDHQRSGPDPKPSALAR